MGLKIDADLRRFHEKTRGSKDQILHGHLTRGTLNVPKGREALRIPLPEIELPRFMHDDRPRGRYGQIASQDSKQGVGQGNGNVGDPLDLANDGKTGRGGHGHGSRDHSYIEFTREDAADFLEKQLKLPNLRETFEGGSIQVAAQRYLSRAKVGPRGLVHQRRTFLESLKRGVANPGYVPGQVVVPEAGDFRYRAPKSIQIPRANAVVIYVKDVSGSTYDVINYFKQICWWTDAWVSKHYHKVVSRYVDYDFHAREVDRDKFYEVDAGGGTSMNSGLARVKKIANEYSVSDYNLFVVHFTDGDAEDVLMEDEFDYEQDGLHETSSVRYNPLSDVLKIANCLFVCEVGAFYDFNYSELLSSMIIDDPLLAKAIRCVSLPTRAGDYDLADLVSKTLGFWFGPYKESVKSLIDLVT